MNDFKKKNGLFIIVKIILIITIVMIVFYFVSTFNIKLSNDSKVWAEFGGFLSPIVSMITMIILIITIQENRIQEEKSLIIKKKEELGSSIINLYREILFYFQEHEEYNKYKKRYKKSKDKLTALQNKSTEIKKEIDLGLDDENIYLEDQLLDLLKKIESNDLILRRLKDKKEADYKNKEKIFLNISRYISDIEILIFLYFSNIEGSEIVARLEYSRILLNGSKDVYKLIRDLIPKIFTDFKRSSLSQIYKIDNRMNKSLSDEKVASLALKSIKEIEKDYNLDILNVVRKETYVPKI